MPSSLVRSQVTVGEKIGHGIRLGIGEHDLDRHELLSVASHFEKYRRVRDD